MPRGAIDDMLVLHERIPSPYEGEGQGEGGNTSSYAVLTCCSFRALAHHFQFQYAEEEPREPELHADS